MARYPDMREMARGASETFDRLESVDQIKPPYPAHGSPTWWALRCRYEQLLFGKIRRERSASSLNPLINEPEADAAKWAALGNETADRDYQRFVRR